MINNVIIYNFNCIHSNLYMFLYIRCIFPLMNLTNTGVWLRYIWVLEFFPFMTRLGLSMGRAHGGGEI